MLYEEYAPITSGIGFVKAQLQVAKDAFLQWQRAILSRYGQSLLERPCAGSLRDAVMQLTPLTSPVCTRYLLLDAGEWTAFLDNGIDGTDAEGVVAVLASDLHATGLRLTAIPETRTSGRRIVRYGATIFQVFQASQTCRRSIACINDGGRWVFEQFGAPFDFEETDAYLAKRKPCRFGVDLLNRYARSMGIAPFDEATFTQHPSGHVRGVLIEVAGRLPQSLQSQGFNEVREKLGLPSVSLR
jgi:hypothetical protein